MLANPSVVLLENIHEAAARRFQDARVDVERLSSALAGEALQKALAGRALAGIRSATRMQAEEIKNARHLLALGCFCIGTSQVDLDAAAREGIAVFNAPFSNTRSVAELVIAEAVLLLRRVPEKSALAHAGKWAKGATGAFEARGKTIAIVGYGNIGSQVGTLAEAMGMRVVYYDTLAKLSLGSARASSSLAEATAQADVVTLHVPATEQTRWMLDAQALSGFKKGAVLINASRGSVVKIEDLAAALAQGRLAGAAIDVFPSEPASNEEAFESSLRNLPNVILTPHIGGSTQEAQENIGVEVSAKLIGFLRQGDTSGSVNLPEVSPGPLRSAARLLNLHGNEPGALARLNSLIAQTGGNIAAQHLQTRGQMGYVVTDLDRAPSADWVARLGEQRGFIRSRLIVAEAAANALGEPPVASPD